MQETGIIRAVNGLKTVIEILNPGSGGCGKCGMKGICSQDGTKRLLTVASRQNLSEGDHVSITVTEASGILYAFVLFIVPLIVFFAVFLTASRWLSEGFAILAGLGGLILAVILNGLLEKKLLKTLQINKIEP